MGHGAEGGNQETEKGDALSDSLVACYEIIRFTIVDAAGKDGEGLKAQAPHFGALVAAYEHDRARMSGMDLAGMPNTGRTLTEQFKRLDAALHNLHMAFVAGNRDQLIGALVAARYQIQDLRETLGALADNAAPAQAEQQQTPPGTQALTPAHFNTLTHVLVDSASGRVTFYGTDDSDGPRQDIPYAQFFAAALRLPDESGTHGTIGSIPGFSLEPIQDIGSGYAQLVDKIRTPEGTATFLSKLQAAMQDDEAGKYILDQCLNDIRAWLKNYVSKRTASRDWVSAMERARDSDELFAVTKNLVKQGVLDKQQDGPAMQQGIGNAIQAAIQARLQRPGGMLFLPEKALKETLGLRYFSRPTFYGIESDTQFARVVFESDVALKNLAGPRGHELVRKLSYHQTLIEWMINHTSPGSLQSYRSPLGIIQVAPETVGLAASADKTVVWFEPTAMKIIVTARDPGQQLSPVQTTYADFLTQHYADYARALPPLWEIREAIKIVAAARLLRKSGRAVSPDDLDTSWSAPPSVETEWDFVVIGLGPSQGPTDGVGYTGGVDLQVQSHMQVADLSAARAQELAASARSGASPSQNTPGLAAGYPIASRPEELENLDPADARANLANLSRKELQDLRDRTMERSRILERQIDILHQRAFGVDLKATAPANFRGWSDVVAEQIQELPGLRLMEELGKRAGQQLDRQAAEGKPLPADWATTLSEFKKEWADLKSVKEIVQKGKEALDGTTHQKLNKLLGAPAEANLSATEMSRLFQLKISNAHDLGRTVSKMVSEDARTTSQLFFSNATIMWESGAAYRAVAQNPNRMEGAVNALPHIEKVMKEMLPRSGELAAVAKAAGADTAELTQVGLRSSVYLKVGEASLGLAYEAANIGIVNEGIRQDRDVNRVLYSELSGNRATLTKRVEENKRLLGLIDQQLSGK